MYFERTLKSGTVFADPDTCQPRIDHHAHHRSRWPHAHEDGHLLRVVNGAH
jgi:hypothetical protein